MDNNYLIPVIPFHEQILQRGEGSFVYDVDGKKYLDLNSGQFCTVLGHSNPELRQCIAEIKLSHTSSGMLSDVVIEAAKELHAISGDLDARSILLSTGAEAVEFAIRYAKHITGKESLVCFDKGYHGLTLGAQSITFGGKYTAPLVNGVYSIPVPISDSNSSLNKLREILEKAVVAAVILEPIVSVGGMIYPQDKFFHQVRELCDEHNTLLIFDESQTGYGRTGSWFCYQEFKVLPDMVILSKGIGLGYPVSAVLFQGKLLEKKITMTHYSSHQNDPFAANIVCFGIRYINEHGLLESNRTKGCYFLEKLKELCSQNSLFINPRGHGMMLGLDLHIDGVENYRPIYQELYNKAAERGLLIQGTDGGRVLRFLPDYIISEQDIDFAVNVLEEIRL